MQIDDSQKEKKLVGRAERIRFPELGDINVHARIDSGARTSAIWGEAKVTEDGSLEAIFFGKPDQRYVFEDYGRQVVANSTGHIDKRFTIKLLVIVKGRKIRATFTIANRQTQVYPVLIGRNVLRGKFIVDVELGKTLSTAEKNRIAQLQSLEDKEENL